MRVSDWMERALFGATAQERVRLMTRRVQRRLVAVLESLEADDLLTAHDNPDEDEMARRIHETRDAPTADIPLAAAVARPVSPVGQHPAFEQPCDAPGCDARSAMFCALPRPARPGGSKPGGWRIIHFCRAHEDWALAQTRLGEPD